MKKSIDPLALCCCIGILLGFLARFVIRNVDPNRLIPVGMVLGLAAGLLVKRLKK